MGKQPATSPRSNTQLPSSNGRGAPPYTPPAIPAVATKPFARGFALDPYASTSTGVLYGGEVTEATSTTFDLAAGAGIIEDWTDPTSPTKMRVEWPEQLGLTPAGLATTNFTSLHIDSDLNLVQLAGTFPSVALERHIITLQLIVHVNNTIIEEINDDRIPAFQQAFGLYDYIAVAGPLNIGNGFSANGSNLLLNKAAGFTILPYINEVIDHLTPSTKTNEAVAEMVMVYGYRDVDPNTYQNTALLTEVDPDQYDDGSGTLSSITGNHFTFQRLYYFGGSNVLSPVYGQATYATQALAISAIETESLDINPLYGRGAWVATLVVKDGTTDLSDTGDALIIPRDPTA